MSTPAAPTDPTDPNALAMAQAVRLLATVAEELKRVTKASTTAAAASVAATAAATSGPAKGKDPSGVESIVPNWRDLSNEQIAEKLRERFEKKRAKREPVESAAPHPPDEPRDDDRPAPRRNDRAGRRPDAAPTPPPVDGRPTLDPFTGRPMPRHEPHGPKPRSGYETPDSDGRPPVTTRGKPRDVFARDWTPWGGRAKKPFSWKRFGRGFGKAAKVSGRSFLGRTQLGRGVAGIGANLKKFSAARASGSAMGMGAAAFRLAGPLAAVTTGAIAAGKALKAFADSALENNRQFAHASASMSLVFAQLDQQRLLLDMKKGERLSGSAKDLADSNRVYDQGTQNIDVAWGRVKNWAGTAINYGLTAILSNLEVQAMALNFLVEQGKDKDRPATFGELAMNMADQAEKDEQDAQKRMDDEKRKAKEKK